MHRRRVLPAVVGAALAATLIIDVSIVATGDLKRSAETSLSGDRLVSVSEAVARPADPVVAPLRRRLTPHLLAASKDTLPADVVEKARKIKGVAGVEVVDAAQARVGGQRVGLLGVDPSTFRSYAPKSSAESDRLWQTVAGGELAISFELGRSGGLALGNTVPAGGSQSPGQVRVGAYAALGITDVDAVVSRPQARALGMPFGNALVISARSTKKSSLEKMTKALKRILPKGARIADVTPPRLVTQAPPREAPRPAARPDGASGPSTPVTGNSMTPRMRTVLLEINNRYGPFPVIGCLRPGDPLDHGTGKACDFMESTAGRMPSASALDHGDQVAQYAIGNAARLGIKYVIWKQAIWNPSVCRCWRRMEDRGSITQNHWDHVHISVY